MELSKNPVTSLFILDLKKKLRSKSLNDFEEMFAQKEEAVETPDVKGGKAGVKGKAPVQKEGKEGKKKGK